MLRSIFDYDYTACVKTEHEQSIELVMAFGVGGDNSLSVKDFTSRGYAFSFLFTEFCGKIKMGSREKRVAMLLLLLVTICGLISFGNAASAHIHSHQHNKPASSERTEDGAFSPRDMDHYAGGEHHQEFDHEAILGTP